MTERILTLPTTRTPAKQLPIINERSILIQDPGGPSLSSHKRVVPLGFCFTFSIVLCMTILFFNPSFLSASLFRDVLRTTSYSSPRRSDQFPNVISPNASTSQFYGGRENVTSDGIKRNKSRERTRKENWFEMMNKCNIFDGKWVKDDSYPLYGAGSCPFIDESFDCYLNGRPDNAYEKYRWQPNHCNIPRLNGKNLLKLLRGKRFVFVGDSLNRNMWESLVCILRNSVKNKSRVFEVSGREEFRSEGSYSFIFQDYDLSMEFFRSPFLLQEWEMPVSRGRKKRKKKTLRIDLIDSSSSRFKSADILVFNTGHWWTHEKTSRGKNYYQEGNHVYSKLDVKKAFRKAMRTWGIWVDANINPGKTFVIFRSYSASHFGGGQWNTGGVCDGETDPITNDENLPEYPPLDIVTELEYSLEEMKTPVFYLNITRISDYRKDAHPSIHRKQNATEEERRTFSGIQDCSHWCLPGVPDTWNELLYAKLLHHQQQVKLKVHRSRKE